MEMITGFSFTNGNQISIHTKDMKENRTITPDINIQITQEITQETNRTTIRDTTYRGEELKLDNTKSIPVVSITLNGMPVIDVSSLVGLMVTNHLRYYVKYNGMMIVKHTFYIHTKGKLEVKISVM